MTRERVDVLIIGAGAAGGVLAKELAEAAFEVVVLEAGPHWIPERDFISDESMAEKLAWTDPRVTTGENPISLAHNVTGKGVGGSTVHYSMVALRMHESDFMVQTLDGVANDWPIRYLAWPLFGSSFLCFRRRARFTSAVEERGRFSSASQGSRLPRLSRMWPRGDAGPLKPISAHARGWA